MEKMINNYKKRILLSIMIYFIGFFIIFPFIMILDMDLGVIKYVEQDNTWISYFIHNYWINILIIIGGLLFSIPSIFIMFINGMVSGFFVSQSIISNTIIDLILGIAAHSIFEIVAMIISGAISFQITAYLYYKFCKRKKVEIDIKLMIKLIAVMTLLTVIAAIIEVTFSFLM